MLSPARATWSPADAQKGFGPERPGVCVCARARATSDGVGLLSAGVEKDLSGRSRKTFLQLRVRVAQVVELCVYACEALFKSAVRSC